MARYSREKEGCQKGTRKQVVANSDIKSDEDSVMITRSGNKVTSPIKTSTSPKKRPAPTGKKKPPIDRPSKKKKSSSNSPKQNKQDPGQLSDDDKKTSGYDKGKT